MSIFLKELIMNKLKHLSSEEILTYGKRYGFSLTKQEAKDVTDYLSTHQINPFNQQDRQKAFQHLAQITSPDTAKKAEKLLIQLIKSYGLESLFN